VDIAGIIKGAADGAGLGNKVGALLVCVCVCLFACIRHAVRCRDTVSMTSTATMVVRCAVLAVSVPHSKCGSGGAPRTLL
jgi:hypothetical protein